MPQSDELAGALFDVSEFLLSPAVFDQDWIGYSPSGQKILSPSDAGNHDTRYGVIGKHRPELFRLCKHATQLLKSYDGRHIGLESEKASGPLHIVYTTLRSLMNAAISTTDGDQPHVWLRESLSWYLSNIDAAVEILGESTARGSESGSSHVGSERETEDMPEILAKAPPLDKQNGKWVSNKDAADREGVETRTLSDYRKGGYFSPDKLAGVDKDSRVWRRRSKTAHPWYWRDSLRYVRA